MKTKGTGTVLPAGSTPAVDTSLTTTFSVTIDGFDDSGLIRCLYPNGFVKHHQAGTVEVLAAQVTSQLRGRYGAGEVTFKEVPKALDAGQSFTVEV